MEQIKQMMQEVILKKIINGDEAKQEQETAKYFIKQIKDQDIISD